MLSKHSIELHSRQSAAFFSAALVISVEQISLSARLKHMGDFIVWNISNGMLPSSGL